MLDEVKTKANPETYKIYDGGLFLFYHGSWGDTLESRNEKAESEPEAQMADITSRMWMNISDK